MSDMWPLIDDEIKFRPTDDGNITFVWDSGFEFFWACKVIGFTDGGVIFEVYAPSGHKYDGLRFECSKELAQIQEYHEDFATFPKSTYNGFFADVLKQAMRKWRAKNEHEQNPMHYKNRNDKKKDD